MALPHPRPVSPSPAVFPGRLDEFHPDMALAREMEKSQEAWPAGLNTVLCRTRPEADEDGWKMDCGLEFVPGGLREKIHFVWPVDVNTGLSGLAFRMTSPATPGGSVSVEVAIARPDLLGRKEAGRVMEWIVFRTLGQWLEAYYRPEKSSSTGNEKSWEHP